MSYPTNASSSSYSQMRAAPRIDYASEAYKQGHRVGSTGKSEDNPYSDYEDIMNYRAGYGDAKYEKESGQPPRYQRHKTEYGIDGEATNKVVPPPKRNGGKSRRGKKQSRKTRRGKRTIRR